MTQLLHELIRAIRPFWALALVAAGVLVYCVVDERRARREALALARRWARSLDLDGISEDRYQELKVSDERRFGR
jgi:hypothetical protein